MSQITVSQLRFELRRSFRQIYNSADYTFTGLIHGRIDFVAAMLKNTPEIDAQSWRISELLCLAKPTSSNMVESTFIALSAHIHAALCGAHFHVRQIALLFREFEAFDQCPISSGVLDWCKQVRANVTICTAALMGENLDIAGTNMGKNYLPIGHPTAFGDTGLLCYRERSEKRILESLTKVGVGYLVVAAATEPWIRSAVDAGLGATGASRLSRPLIKTAEKRASVTTWRHLLLEQMVSA
jgi:hypothetical protein